jgi:hypothetical protein
MRKKDLQAVLSTTKSIVGLLRDPTVLSPYIDVSINERDFTKSMLSGSMKYFVLTEFAKVVHADYHLESPRNGMFDVKPFVLRILTRLSRLADRTTFYVPVSTEESEFESILFSNAFPFAEVRDDILRNFAERPRADFTERVLGFYLRVNAVLGINDGIRASICILLMFRILFDRAYEVNPKWFYPGELIGLQAVSHQICVGELDIEPKYLNGMDLSATVYDAFGRDPFFLNCAKHLEVAVMYTNPFDALYQITEMIGCIERFATEQRNGGLLPFEVTFGFYIGAMLVSAVPSFEELAAFIADCAPASGLCPAFEFASATTAAAGRYCNTLRRRIQN